MGLTDTLGTGGGNRFTGTITALEFSPEFPYEAKNKQARKKSDFETLWCNITIRTDAAEQGRIEPIFAGDARKWDISNDGHSVSPTEGLERIPTVFGAIVPLLKTMVAHGFPDFDYDENEGTVDLSTLLNQRFDFVKVKDEEATKRQGKQKGKDGKEYDRKRLEVSEYHGEGSEDTGGGTRPTGRGSNSKTTTSPSKFAKGGKTNGKAKEEAEELTAYADSVLLELLQAAKGNKIDKSALTGLVTRKLLGNPQREAVRKLLFSDEYLGREEGWSYDQSSKGQTIELA